MSRVTRSQSLRLNKQPEKITDTFSVKKGRGRPRKKPVETNNNSEIIREDPAKGAAISQKATTPVQKADVVERKEPDLVAVVAPLLTSKDGARKALSFAESSSKEALGPSLKMRQNLAAKLKNENPLAELNRSLPSIAISSPRQPPAPSPRQPPAPSPRQPPAPSPRKAAAPRVAEMQLESKRTISPLRLSRQDGACYQKAKRALASSLPDRILCREAEIAKVTSFLQRHVERRHAGSLYISGPPGTGKTAVLSMLLTDLKENLNCHTVYINCMSCRNSQAVFNKILGQLSGKDSCLQGAAATAELQRTMTSSSPRMVVLILDEIDQLESKNQDILYTMFELCLLKNSRAVLIGIANTLDLTDRVLPRLKAKSYKPEQVIFSSYTKDQLVKILTDRLEQVQVAGECVLEPSAIQFCARKVSAAGAGDMRKALDICRRAIEMVEKEVRKTQVLKAVRNLPAASPTKTVLSPSKNGENIPQSPRKNLFLSPTKSPRKNLYLSPKKSPRKSVLLSPTKNLLLSPTKQGAASVSLKSLTLSPVKSPQSKPALKKINIAHIAKIMNEVYGSKVGNGAENQTIPLQQKLVLCAILLLTKEIKIKEVQIGKLHDAYVKICRFQEVCAVDQSEFLALCGLIESKAIIAVKKKKDTRTGKVSLKVNEDELKSAVNDNTLISLILQRGLS